jgi:hypothetical protein
MTSGPVIGTAKPFHHHARLHSLHTSVMPHIQHIRAGGGASSLRDNEP